MQKMNFSYKGLNLLLRLNFDLFLTASLIIGSLYLGLALIVQ
ncbi:hypothetical protein SAMN04488118_103277 [Epibacterium ulvae]|uniref:Uncharacterized protein n=1 Tax=Epibacterium ulvae TaxID=1156985 RepID=A0A1G5Q958_9RHOB|nr:hypothetical protein SAMN04488118_103277 [Epibacterium ulvae]